MKITFNPAVGVKQPTFRAVNMSYLKRAQKMYAERGAMTSEWYEALHDAFVLFKEISKQDALDTMVAAKKYADVGMEGFNSLYKYIKNY